MNSIDLVAKQSCTTDLIADHYIPQGRDMHGSRLHKILSLLSIMHWNHFSHHVGMILVSINKATAVIHVHRSLESCEYGKSV